MRAHYWPVLLSAAISFSAPDRNETFAASVFPAKRGFVLPHEYVEISYPAVTIYGRLRDVDGANVLRGETRVSLKSAPQIIFFAVRNNDFYLKFVFKFVREYFNGKSWLNEYRLDLLENPEAGRELAPAKAE